MEESQVDDEEEELEEEPPPPEELVMVCNSCKRDCNRWLSFSKSRTSLA